MPQDAAILQVDLQQSQSGLNDPLKGDFGMLDDTLKNLQGEEELNSAASPRKDGEDQAEIDEVEPYYKFANPMFIQELDWAITFSKYDFPWREIRFGKFSAKECYLKYTSTIRDSQAFLKKVLGSKDKFKKLMASFLGEAPRVFFGTSPEEEGRDEAEPAEGLDQAADAAHESDAEQFCRCKGSFKSVTGYFVACESDAACPNGGWLHPECTTDLQHLTKEQIDTMAAWYCEDCRA